jgi:hypothetical protein
VPRTLEEYVEHVDEYEKEVADEKYKRAMNNRAHEEQRLKQNRDLATFLKDKLLFTPVTQSFLENESAVLNLSTQWSHWYQPTDLHPLAPWPAREEFKEEGDERHTSGFGRFMPIPRVPGNTTVAYKFKTYVKPYPLDYVFPVPDRGFFQTNNDLDDDSEEISYSEDFIAAEKLEAIFATRLVDGDLFEFGPSPFPTHQDGSNIGNMFGADMDEVDCQSPPTEILSNDSMFKKMLLNKGHGCSDPSERLLADSIEDSVEPSAQAPIGPASAATLPSTNMPECGDQSRTLHESTHQLETSTSLPGELLQTRDGIHSAMAMQDLRKMEEVSPALSSSDVVVTKGASRDSSDQGLAMGQVFSPESRGSSQRSRKHPSPSEKLVPKVLGGTKAIYYRTTSEYLQFPTAINRYLMDHSEELSKEIHKKGWKEGQIAYFQSKRYKVVRVSR